MRLSAVSEWSVEYGDDLDVTIWVSTATADYKLLSSSALYSNLWATLQRKTALAARVIRLLVEEPKQSYKGLVRQTLRCNSIPGAIKFRPVRPAPPPPATQNLPPLPRRAPK